VVRVTVITKRRQVFVRQPVMGKSAAELHAYVAGADPITGVKGPPGCVVCDLHRPPGSTFLQL